MAVSGCVLTKVLFSFLFTSDIMLYHVALQTGELVCLGRAD